MPARAGRSATATPWIERAVPAFMQRRRPPEEIRAELDIEHRFDGRSLEILDLVDEDAYCCFFG